MAFPSCPSSRPGVPAPDATLGPRFPNPDPHESHAPHPAPGQCSKRGRTATAGRGCVPALASRAAAPSTPPVHRRAVGDRSSRRHQSTDNRTGRPFSSAVPLKATRAPRTHLATHLFCCRKDAIFPPVLPATTYCIKDAIFSPSAARYHQPP